MQIKEMTKKTGKKMPAETYTAELKKMRTEHEKLKKGMFEFSDAKGGWFDFSIRTFPGEPVKTIRLVHGEICELPMGIIKILNNCKRKIRTIGLDNGANRGNELPGRGLPSTYTVESRVRFIPMDVL